jgi:hypothetical protein
MTTEVRVKSGIRTKEATSKPPKLYRKRRQLQGSHEAEVAGSWEEPYLEPSSFDAPVEFVILTAPAPKAVGHSVALTQRQAASVTCPLLPGVHFGLLSLGRTQPELDKPGSPFLLFLPSCSE